MIKIFPKSARTRTLAHVQKYHREFVIEQKMGGCGRMKLQTIWVASPGPKIFGRRTYDKRECLLWERGLDDRAPRWGRLLKKVQKLYKPLTKRTATAVRIEELRNTKTGKTFLVSVRGGHSQPPCIHCDSPADGFDGKCLFHSSDDLALTNRYGRRNTNET